MLAPTARRLATAGSLSLALALAAPAAAFAGHDDDAGKEGKNGGKPTPAATSTASPAPAAGSSQGGSAADSQQGKGSSAKKSEKRGKTPAERSAKGGDPRGNNGTVKIDGEAFDDGRGNEPHVGCVFQVDFYGFDAGDTATITFTGKAPTGGGLLHSETRTLISNDAAGGGQDRDATLTYSVSNQLSELLSVTPHPKQGWHVKLAVDVDSAPGGAKQKVFWIDCPQTPTVPGTTAVAPTVSGTTTAPATAGGGGTRTAVVDRAPLAPTFGAGGTTLDAGTTQAAATGGQGADAATVVAQSTARPSALPFTGTEGLGYLLALGLSAVGVGTVAHRLGRRRATTV